MNYKWFEPYRPDSLGELKHAYHDLSKQHHPDHGGSSNIMKEINREYEELKHQFKCGDSYDWGDRSVIRYDGRAPVSIIADQDCIPDDSDSGEHTNPLVYLVALFAVALFAIMTAQTGGLILILLVPIGLFLMAISGNGKE